MLVLLWQQRTMEAVSQDSVSSCGNKAWTCDARESGLTCNTLKITSSELVLTPASPLLSDSSNKGKTYSCSSYILSFNTEEYL